VRETLLGEGGFLAVMASSLKRKGTKKNDAEKYGPDRKELLIKEYKHNVTLHCKKHNKRETKE